MNERKEKTTTHSHNISVTINVFPIKKQQPKMQSQIDAIVNDLWHFVLENLLSISTENFHKNIPFSLSLTHLPW